MVKVWIDLDIDVPLMDWLETPNVARAAATSMLDELQGIAGYEIAEVNPVIEPPPAGIREPTA